MLDLQPIKDRLAAATPGPWWASKEKTFGTYLAIAVVGCNEVQAKHDGYRYSDDADADLIANAPQDLAALVAEVERLENEAAVMQQVTLAGLAAEVERLRAAIGAHREQCHRTNKVEMARWDWDLWEVLQ